MKKKLIVYACAALLIFGLAALPMAHTNTSAIKLAALCEDQHRN